MRSTLEILSMQFPQRGYCERARQGLCSFRHGKDLGVKLPDDYKESLRITNGMKAHTKITFDRLLGPVKSTSRSSSEMIEKQKVDRAVDLVGNSSLWPSSKIQWDWASLDRDSFFLIGYGLNSRLISYLQRVCKMLKST